MPRTIFFLANFGLSKVAIYAIPLLIAAVAPPEVYGAIEFGWAFALLAAALLFSAPLGGINQRYIVQKDRRVSDELALTAFIGGAIAILLWVGAEPLGARPEWAVALASLGVATLHNVASTLFRMRGDRTLTAWFDGTATIAAALIVGALWLAQPAMTVHGLGVAYAFAAAGIAAGGLALFLWLREAGLMGRIARSWTIGLPMLVGGILAMWLGVGGRMIVGFVDASYVAAYSVMFRVAGLALGIHQLAITALYARLYGARTREADRLLLPFLAGVGALTALIALAAPPLVHVIGFKALHDGGEAMFRKALPIVCIQVFFWIAFAMLQMRINRSGLAGRAIWPVLWVTLIGTAAILASAKLFSLGLIGLCWGIALHSAAYFVAEWLVLVRARLPHRKVGQCALAFGLLLAVIALVNQMLQPAI